MGARIYRKSFHMSVNLKGSKTHATTHTFYISTKLRTQIKGFWLNLFTFLYNFSITSRWRNTQMAHERWNFFKFWNSAVPRMVKIAILFDNTLPVRFPFFLISPLAEEISCGWDGDDGRLTEQNLLVFFPSSSSSSCSARSLRYLLLAPRQHFSVMNILAIAFSHSFLYIQTKASKDLKKYIARWEQQMLQFQPVILSSLQLKSRPNKHINTLDDDDVNY